MSDKPTLKQTILETERLFLRELNWEIMYNLFTYYTDDEIVALMGLNSENELELERMKFDQGMTTYRMTFKTFLMVDKASGKIIGRTGFHNWYPQHFRSEMGYYITDDRYLNKGLMTEANKALIQYGFEEMDLNRIEAFTSPNNEPSKKILTKLGFKKEGILREHFFKDNRMEDSICFALLRKEYHK
ncbi:MAG TPA: GNAT family protein [Flavipsychrobacter sp.]|nr:GNAT family protein [Flavipsychrobacter sp.]